MRGYVSTIGIFFICRTIFNASIDLFIYLLNGLPNVFSFLFNSIPLFTRSAMTVSCRSNACVVALLERTPFQERAHVILARFQCPTSRETHIYWEHSRQKTSSFWSFLYGPFLGSAPSVLHLVLFLLLFFPLECPFFSFYSRFSPCSIITTYFLM